MKHKILKQTLMLLQLSAMVLALGCSGERQYYDCCPIVPDRRCCWPSESWQ